MRRLIIAWSVFALILEFAILFTLDKYVLVDSYDFEINEAKEEETEIADISTVIKEGSEDISLSYNGKYISYFYDGSLCVEETKLGTVNKVPANKIMYYKWLENRNIIAMVEMNKDGEVRLETYNPSDGSKSDVQEICNYYKDMRVENMATSVLTNVYYINIDKGSGNSVYRIDRNNEITNVNIRADILGNMKTIPHEDRLIYEDKSNGKHYITSPNDELKFIEDGKWSLLSIDKNDVIYMGEFKEGKVCSVLYGKISESTSNWKEVKLDEPVNSKDIYFNDESQIVVNNEAKHTVKNMMTGKETEYNGSLIQVNEDFVASIDNDRKLKYLKLTK